MLYQSTLVNASETFSFKFLNMIPMLALLAYPDADYPGADPDWR